MIGTWTREEEPEVAIQRIFDGAARAFVELGVSGAGMGEIARYVGCSRGTLYRYFKNRHDLHLAFVNDRALRLVAELQAELKEIEDPVAQLTGYILKALEKVRSTPSMAVWFSPTEAGRTARMSRGSEVVLALAETFVSTSWKETDDSDDESGLRARWIVRVMISLLTMPARTEEEERFLIERFLVPGVLPGH